jgi:hypothetical protein
VRVTKFLEGVKVAEELPADYPMVDGVTDAPLHTNQYEANKPIREFLQGREYLLKQLIDKLTS